MRESHDEIVKEILPRLAEKLKQEGRISSYGRQQEVFTISEDLSEIRINPDLVLHLSSGKKVLVEVANAKDPKRFIGEIIYSKILIHKERITAALVFILNAAGSQQAQRSQSQIIALHESLSMPRGLRTVGWSGEDNAYGWLRDFVERFSHESKNSK